MINTENIYRINGAIGCINTNGHGQGGDRPTPQGGGVGVTVYPLFGRSPF